MKDAFGSDISNLPDFPGLLTVIQGGAQGSGLPGSAEIRSLIHSLESLGGTHIAQSGWCWTRNVQRRPQRLPRS